ncbi:hypothetical protein CUMW_121940 [Citrus unshiu]|nr:hypothetical protein CUMW_121940 [Citrus unshiu]
MGYHAISNAPSLSVQELFSTVTSACKPSTVEKRLFVLGRYQQWKTVLVGHMIRLDFGRIRDWPNSNGARRMNPRKEAYEDVLAHQAICGFLTHSGWNSASDGMVWLDC